MPRPGMNRAGPQPGGYHPGPRQMSPSQNPQGFQRGIQNYFGGLAGQLGGQGQGGGGKPRTRTQTITDSFGNDPGSGQSDMGPQQFGTYAPDIEKSQFTKENFGRGSLKGLKQLDTGGFGGFGGIGGFGGMGGGGMGGGYGQDPMMFMQMLMGLMGQLGGQEDSGPIRGK